MCYILKVKKKKKIKTSQNLFPGDITEMYKNPPQQRGVLSLQEDCHHCLGLSRVWSPHSGVQPGFVHHSKPRLQAWGQPKVLWALLDASRLKEYKADGQRRWPQSSVVSRWGVIPNRDERGAQAIWHMWALLTETTSSEISHITPTSEKKNLRL